MPDLQKLLRSLKYHFGKPQSMTWSFLLLISSIFTALFFALKCTLGNMDLKVPTTSLVGYSIFMPLFILFALVLPALLLNDGDTSALTGNYTGTGILVISFLSGLPVMLLSTVLYNIVTWLFLKAGSKIYYPAFFFYGGTETKIGTTLAIISDTVIPAFGICIFFFGLLWSRFRFSQKRLAYFIIILAYTLFSMDILGILSSLLVGWWCCRLRDKTDGVYAPFLCLLSSRICTLLFSGTLPKINIFTIQTYSDIPSSFFYAALPSTFIAIILLAYFMRLFDDYYYKYMGSDVPADDESIPSTTINLNFGLIVSMLIMISIWIFMFKGAHL
ncbi:MAG: hypothetical protein MJ108_02945 [Saccharofermentans sp.]|nr:hypothetical protein [Saccharofermentans sp.]